MAHAEAFRNPAIADAGVSFDDCSDCDLVGVAFFARFPECGVVWDVPVCEGGLDNFFCCVLIVFFYCEAAVAAFRFDCFGVFGNERDQSIAERIIAEKPATPQCLHGCVWQATIVIGSADF